MCVYACVSTRLLWIRSETFKLKIFIATQTKYVSLFYNVSFHNPAGPESGLYQNFVVPVRDLFAVVRNVQTTVAPVNLSDNRECISRRVVRANTRPSNAAQSRDSSALPFLRRALHCDKRGRCTTPPRSWSFRPAPRDLVRYRGSNGSR